MCRIDFEKELPGLEVLADEPMRDHTTFRIGGPARTMVCPATAEEASAVLRLCRAQGVTPFFLGNGSNLLVSDRGYDGVILSTRRLLGMGREGDILYAGSGVFLSRLANLAAEEGLTGLEFASGIPGSVGGGVRMNAGAYGGELVQTLEWAEYLDETGELHRLSGRECGLSYRHSLFCEKPWLVTAAAFRLTPGDPEEIRGRMAELSRRRREKQPLEYPSAGSTFKRPAPVDGEPRYAAALIDGCLLKGLRVGDAQVSKKHAGFVVNLGEATARDVLTLMDQVQSEVERQTGVRLEPEVEFLGEKEGV